MKIIVGLLLCFAKIINRINKNQPKKYDLIIVRRDRIGDFILWMGCAQKIREYFHDKSICLICGKYNFNIAQLSGLFDHIEIIDDQIGNLKKIIGLNCTKLIIPTRTRNLREELLCTAIAAEEKIAIQNDEISCICGLNQKKIYDHVIFIQNPSTPEIQINTYFCNQMLGLEEDDLYADLSSIIKKRIINEAYFVVNLGSSTGTKNWPVERFIELVERIEIKDRLCVLVGSKSEINSSETFTSAYNGKVKDLTGKTSLQEMIELIAFADFVICNDTSSVHISAACETKCFWICWGVHLGRFSRYPESDLSFRNNIPISVIDDSKSCLGCCLKNGVNIKKECAVAMKKNTLLPCVEGISVEKALAIVLDSLK